MSYTFYDSEGIFISASIDSIAFNNDNYLYYSYYPSLYTIRNIYKYIIKAFSIMTLLIQEEIIFLIMEKI